jgi:serine/threonine-protein kinase
MYHLMTAQLPFPGSSPIERLGKRISGRHVPITEHLPDLPQSFVRVIDRLLAHKPHERYPKASDAAEALERLLRPRSRAAANALVAPPPPAPPSPLAVPAAASAPQAPEAKVQPANVAGGPMVVTVRPKYPRWFEPAARLVETRPQFALAGVILTLAIVFSMGAALGLLIRALLR